MRHTTTIITLLFISFYCLVALQLVTIVRAEQEPDASTLLIVELQTGSANSASEEFIEISNTTADEISLSGVVVEYKSAIGDTWHQKTLLSGTVRPFARILAASYELNAHQFSMKSGLAAAGGHIRVRGQDGQVFDLVGWGTANQSDGQAAEVAIAGQSLKRTVDEDGYFINTNDNHSNLFLSDNPSPHMDELVIKQTEQDGDESEIATVDIPGSGEALQATQQQEPVAVAPSELKTNTANVKIVEVMPDPVKPQTDAEHELIELFNAGTAAVNLQSYVLETGIKGQYDYTLPNLELSAGEYFALYSADTGLVLSNSGGKVALLGPDGSEIDSIQYSKAKSGKSWAKVAGEWVWTQPSPNRPNPIAAGAEVTTNNTDQADDDASSQLEKKDVDYAATTDASNESSSTEDQNSLNKQVAEPTTINNTILAGVGVLAVLYMIYEYRGDIRIYFRRIRGYLAGRKAARSKS